MGAAFAPLPLIRDLTKVCGFPLVCLERRKLANSCSTRHSETKAETNFTAAGAGERGTFGLRAACGGWPHERPPAGG